ncbi:uracil permease [Rhizina undulata]
MNYRRFHTGCNSSSSSTTHVTVITASSENEPLLPRPLPATINSKTANPQAAVTTKYTARAMRMEKGTVRTLLQRVECGHEPGLTNAQLMLTNHDLKPVEPARRQWGSWNYVGFWIADSFNINTWMIASSMILSGLSPYQSLICVLVGYFISASFICATGRIGATYHIGFPVVVRSSFGIFGSLWPVINRAGMACVWYGVQAWMGGECVSLMIRAIWPSYANLTGNLSGTTVGSFVSFFLFWLASLPAIWFPVEKIRHLFTVKAYVVPVAGLAFFGWSIKKAGGLGPVISQPNTIHGSSLAWGIISGIMTSIANFSTLIVNDPDFSRFATKPQDAFWSQLIAIPVSFTITSFIGIVVSSSSSIIYNTPIWNPLDLLSRFLEEGGSRNRAGVFFISAAFALAQLGTNIAANSVSAGSDMTALVPRFINIRRGGYICALIGLAMCPWNLLSSSNNFTLYLSSYSVFLSSIAGVMISDYYWVRKGYFRVKDLYTARKNASYHFTWGVNFRAYAAYIAGIAINVVGFAGAIGRTVPVGARYIYNINFFAGFIVSGVVYWALNKFFPVPAISEKWMEVGEEITEVRLAEVEDEDEDLERGDSTGKAGSKVDRKYGSAL